MLNLNPESKKYSILILPVTGMYHSKKIFHHNKCKKCTLSKDVIETNLAYHWSLITNPILHQRSSYICPSDAIKLYHIKILSCNISSLQQFIIFEGSGRMFWQYLPLCWSMMLIIYCIKLTMLRWQILPDASWKIYVMFLQCEVMKQM